MNQALEEIGCEVVESDLGEYILQVDDHEPPSHIVAPALHMTKEQIREVFHERLGYEMSDTPEEMTSFVRAILREKFLEADIGVTGCNFAVANTGSICLVTNEGNADLVTLYRRRILPLWEWSGLFQQWRSWMSLWVFCAGAQSVKN